MVMELPTTLLGRYALEEVVGVGGMGTVVRARDDTLQRTVAVKLLKPELSTENDMIERFRREARIAAALSHPGIAQVYDFAEEGGRIFIVMEYLEGEDLQSLLSREGALEPRVAAAIGAECAEALEAAHRYGAVHRDVKPANIFLTKSGMTKLTDFGIARAASQAAVTVTGSVIGTSLYISPEQATGAAATPAGDLYSLGCVLFQMVTGQAPFQAESQVAVAMAHLTEEPPKAREINPSVPKELDEIIAKSMAKSPDDRFPSAGEMSVALRKAASGAPVPAPAARVAYDSDKTRVISAGPDQLELGGTQELPSPTQKKTEVAVSREARSVRRRLLAVGILALLIAAVWVARLIAPEPSPEAGQRVKVPNFTGLSFVDAQGKAQELGITVEKDEKPSDRPLGRVFEQDQKAGTLIDPQVVVKLAVSIGPRVNVPNVTNLRLEEAKEILSKHGFEVKVEGPGDGDSTVVSQTPGANAEVRPNSEIVLTTEDEDKKRGKGRGGDD